MAHILVTGANGMLGHIVCRVLSQNHNVVGVCRGPRAAYRASDWMQGSRVSLLDQVDLADPQVLAERLPTRDISVVINCAGLIKQRPEAGEPLAILQANALVPRRLAQWCGEITAAPHLTLRTSLIGPQLDGQEGLFAWFVAQRGRTVQGYANAVFSGLTTFAFAQILDRIVGSPSVLSGLYHVASRPISKYALLREIDRRLALGVTVVRDESMACDRSLDGGRFIAASGIAIPDWKEMLDALCSNPNSGGAAWTATRLPTTALPAGTFS